MTAVTLADSHRFLTTTGLDFCFFANQELLRRGIRAQPTGLGSERTGKGSPSMKEFLSKVAIVTGTSGIGRAISLRLAAAGASVLACGIEAAANRELQQEADAQGCALRAELCDVSRPEQVQAVVQKAVTQFGGLDFLANCAAIHPFGTVVETAPETWNECLAVNLGSVYLLSHFGIPEMTKRGGGSIVVVASVQGHACQRGVAAYAASKGALHSLTRALALDHASVVRHK